MSDVWQYQCSGHDFSNMSEQQKMQLTFSYDDFDDVDRQDMLSNYASETYLQRWDQLQNKDSEEDPRSQQHADMKVVITERKLEGEVKQLLGTTSDHDNMSLASYNSVDDEKPDVMSSIMTDILCCPYHLDIGRQISGAWRGYGDNIYFNPLNCQQLQILTSKQVRRQVHKSSGKENTCHRKLVFQQEQENKHNSCLSTVDCSDITSQQHPVYSNLGSLRINQTSRQRKCMMPFQHKLKGKICKGLSERFAFQALQKQVSESTSCVSKPKLLDGSTHHNQTVRIRDFRLTGRNTFPLVFSSEKSVPKTKEQILKAVSLPRIGDKAHKNHVPSIKRSNSSKAVSVQDPRPVLIIPFGTFDDPVVDQDSDISSSSKKKLKQEHSSEKPNIVKGLNQTKNIIPSEKETIKNGNVKKGTLDHQQTKSSKNKAETEKNDSKNQENLNQELDKAIPTEADDKVTTKKIIDLERPKMVSPRLSSEESLQCPNSTLKSKKLSNANKQNKAKTTPQVATTTVNNKSHSSVRKILSNSSLSSYLSATFTYDKNRPKSEHNNAAKLSYTKRMKPVDVQTTDRYIKSRQSSVSNISQLNTYQNHVGNNVTFKGFVIGSNSRDVEKEGKHFEVVLKVQDKEADTGYSSRLFGFSKSDGGSPQRGIRKRASTKSGINVKFSIDSPVVTNRKLMINGREYQVSGNQS